MNTKIIPTCSQKAFSRLDATAIVFILCLLALVGIPVVTGNGLHATGVTCTDNLRRLTLAWQLYSTQSDGKLVNNFGFAETMGTASAGAYLNWNHNLMDWTTNPSNTNRTLMSNSKLYPFLDNAFRPFKCPADRSVSAHQTQAGWTTGRLRSYSMNGFMGPYSSNSNDPTYKGENWFSPQYRQFILDSSITYPDRSIVFLDEHPDSINDGLFINTPNSFQWLDLPASYHAGAAGTAFADGHVEIHAWQYTSTKPPVRFSFSGAGPISSSQRGDFQWLTQRMTVSHPTLGVVAAPGNATLIWTPTTSTYQLQSSPSLDQSDWTTVPNETVRGSGQVSVTTPKDGAQRYFRLIRP